MLGVKYKKMYMAQIKKKIFVDIDELLLGLNPPETHLTISK